MITSQTHVEDLIKEWKRHTWQVAGRSSVSDPSLSHFQRPKSQRQAQPDGWEDSGAGENANLYLIVMTEAMEELRNMNSTNSKVMHILEPRPGFLAKKAQITEVLSSRESIYTLSKPQNA